MGGSTWVAKSKLCFSVYLELVQPIPSRKVILDGRLHSFATGVKMFDLDFGLILSGCGLWAGQHGLRSQNWVFDYLQLLTNFIVFQALRSFRMARKFVV